MPFSPLPFSLLNHPQRTHHGVRFAAARDAVGEEQSVLAVEQVAHQRLGDGVEHLLLRGAAGEHRVELVLLLLGRAIAECLWVNGARVRTATPEETTGLANLTADVSG